MTGNLILQYWSSVFFIIAVGIDVYSNWYPTFDYLKATIDINQ
jgi:hypothetical protein